MAGREEDEVVEDLLLQDQEPDQQQPPQKRLCIEYLGESLSSSENSCDTKISMDNSSEVVTKIAGLYAERLMSDVILVVGKQELAAHRLILCASSEVFQIMLMSTNWSESSERKIVLKESPACEAVFEVFLKYLYTGKISVDYANVIPILQLADKYNVKDLLRVGLDFMSRNVPLAGKKNQVVSWYQFTTNCGYKHVSHLCLDFIKWNFDLVSRSIDWPNLELESLVLILSSSDIVTLQEMMVFRSLESWLTTRRQEMKERGEENINLHMERLTLQCMEHVRFPMMTPAHLADLLLSPLISRHMEQMVSRMAAAMAYHRSVNTELILTRVGCNVDIFRNTEDSIANLLKYKNGDKLLTPRLYTEDKYCASLSIDYFFQVSLPSLPPLVTDCIFSCRCTTAGPSTSPHRSPRPTGAERPARTGWWTSTPGASGSRSVSRSSPRAPCRRFRRES